MTNHKTPSLLWLDKDASRETRSRFLVIDVNNEPGHDNLVSRAWLGGARKAFRDASILIYVVTGIHLVDRLFGDENRLCVLPAGDDSLFPDRESLPSVLLPRIPQVQCLIDALRMDVTQPSVEAKEKLAIAETAFNADGLTRLKQAIYDLAGSTPRTLVFGDLEGKRVDLALPPKPQLERVKPTTPKPTVVAGRIKAIEPLTHLTSETGSLYCLPTHGVAEGVRAGVLVDLRKVKAPAKASWRVAAAVRLCAEGES